MNKITNTLLGGAALCALASVPAIAAPHFAVTALHAGNVVNKTVVPHNNATKVTYTFAVYSSQSASSVGQNIYGTFYKWNSVNSSGNYTLCSNPKQKLKTPKKTVYGSTKAGTETYSYGCASGPTVFHGDVYTGKTGVSGDTDTWVSTLKGKFNGSSGKTKGTLNLDVTLHLL